MAARSHLVCITNYISLQPQPPAGTVDFVSATKRNPRRNEKATGDVRLVDGLVQLSFLIQAVLGRVAATHDLSIIQVRLLGVLRGREPGMLELAAHLNIDKSSLTGLVDRAEERGLVRRIKVPVDQRAVHVGLTARGKELAARFAGEVEQHLLALVAGLDAKERKQVSALAMQIVMANVGRQLRA